jgi:hypothetical protein
MAARPLLWVLRKIMKKYEVTFTILGSIEIEADDEETAEDKFTNMKDEDFFRLMEVSDVGVDGIEKL